jgi:hypothetical protein
MTQHMMQYMTQHTKQLPRSSKYIIEQLDAAHTTTIRGSPWTIHDTHLSIQNMMQETTQYISTSLQQWTKQYMVQYRTQHMMQCHDTIHMIQHTIISMAQYAPAHLDLGNVTINDAGTLYRT